MRRGLLVVAAVMLLGGGGPALAQTASPAASGPDVVVQGVRSRLSGWREAETSHVILLSDGSEADLVRIARNLERLHFLLLGLLGRTDSADPTIKLRVTLIGDVPLFQAMDLRNRRWQQGPFADLFSPMRYYDPRETGAVMATTRVDQRTIIERQMLNGRSVQSMLSDPSLRVQLGAADPASQAALASAAIGDFAMSGMAGASGSTTTFGENAITVPADSLIYAGYAQHYLQTYFPAAYPRWYLDGFAQVFSTLVVKGDHQLDYGRSPAGTSAVLRAFGRYPIGDVLNDRYLAENPRKTGWTPIHAWMLTHFLLFSDSRRPQLRQYLALRAGGADAETAAKVFGDQQALAQELRRYFGSRKPYETVTYAPGLIEQPVVHRLTEGEAAFVQGQLEMGSRVEIPAAPSADTPPELARSITQARDEAIRARDTWLARLRRDAARWPGEYGAQALLAEAECRSGHAPECLAAATHAVALAPQDADALAWVGMARAMQAASETEPARSATLAEARKAIAAANRLDTRAVVPLLAYYRSFALAGQAAPDNAIDGLQAALAEVPNAPSNRLDLAEALAAKGGIIVARRIAMPVAKGAYDSPERARAEALVARASR